MISLDTNVLVYAADRREPAKQPVAQQVLAAAFALNAPLSLQVVGELQNALSRRLRQPAHEASLQARNVRFAWPVFGYNLSDVDRALARSATGQLSYWDALLCASCNRHGVDVLLSEDMGDGETYDGVRVINPFTQAGGLSDAARRVLQL